MRLTRANAICEGIKRKLDLLQLVDDGSGAVIGGDRGGGVGLAAASVTSQPRVEDEDMGLGLDASLSEDGSSTTSSLQLHWAVQGDVNVESP